MKRNLFSLPLLFLISLALTTQSSGELVTSLPDGTVIAFPAINYYGSGPQVFGPDIMWSSNYNSSMFPPTFGYTGGYAFTSNGIWYGSVMGPFAGLNTYGSALSTGLKYSMTFSFSTPVYGVGGLLNYGPLAYPYPEYQASIAVYDSQNSLIESYVLNFSTGGIDNTGFFFGFLEDSPIISYFTLTDLHIGITNLTIANNGPAPVPEPSTLLLVGFGMTCLVGYARKRGRTATQAKKEISF